MRNARKEEGGRNSSSVAAHHSSSPLRPYPFSPAPARLDREDGGERLKITRTKGSRIEKSDQERILLRSFLRTTYFLTRGLKQWDSFRTIRRSFSAVHSYPSPTEYAHSHPTLHRRSMRTMEQRDDRGDRARSTSMELASNTSTPSLPLCHFLPSSRTHRRSIEFAGDPGGDDRIWKNKGIFFIRTKSTLHLPLKLPCALYRPLLSIQSHRNHEINPLEK